MSLLANHGLIFGSSAFDADYQAVLDRATLLGYTLPSSGQQTKQNDFVVALKAAGVWSLLDVMYVFATDGDRNYAKINWKSPTTFFITEPVPPTFTANQGFKGNGTSQYMNTGWKAATNGVNFTLSDASFGFHFNTTGSGRNGAQSGTQGGLWVDAATIFFRLNDLAGAVLAAQAFPHFSQMQRISNSVKDFINGSSIGGYTAAPTSRSEIDFYICADNNAGTPAVFNTFQISFVFIGAGLNGKESAFYTAWNNYKTSI